MGIEENILQRLNVMKIDRLGWKAKCTSDEAVRNAIRDIIGKEKNSDGVALLARGLD